MKKKLLLWSGAGALALAATVAPLAQFNTTAQAQRSSPTAIAMQEPTPYRTGNVIFIHPDGTGYNHWAAGRMYWYGPDAQSEWDGLPEMALYHGHMADLLTGTSNGGATTHAFGYKVEGLGSFGKDGEGETARTINSLGGYSGSIMRQAGNAGHPIGVVNDGDAAEPGTGAFLAEVGNRNNSVEIVTQIIDGRPGANDTDPAVVLGGGEAFFLPEGTPRCESAEAITPACAVHSDPVDGAGPERTDGRNLIQEAIDDGWTVIRTRQEFDTINAQLAADPSFAPKLLGLFAADDIFNDEPEEVLIGAGLVNPELPANSKEGNLILYGDRPGTLGFNPPTAPEMMALALTILDRRSEQVGRDFMLVSEVESTDNLGNNANAIGTLTAIKRANEVIGLARAFQANTDPDTLIVTAADSDAGGLQIVSNPRLDEAGNVSTISGNPTGNDELDAPFPVDGIAGRGTPPFIAAPDAYGQQLPFAIAWVGTPDVAGGILSRAQGLNADLLRTQFGGVADNTSIYRIMYATMFGELLPSSIGQRAPDR